ncbi:MAG TPA: helix-turn-helix transcriptional regulator [Mycobacteriales bacterium]|nr:helix-turn-helix transcriptional regulator [Mycobacteriales bacterium]
MTAIAPSRGRRDELRSFLRARRAELSPQEVGIEPGSRRRTPGLRREEVALLAGVGVTWYTWLEQGRPINASAQVLDAVARTLKLDGPERWHLYRLAEATPVRSPGEQPIPPSVDALLRSLDPVPAVLLDAQLDVLASNEAHEHLFREWHTLPCIHKNLLWCCLTEESAREKFVNFDSEVPYLVARLRAEFAHHLDDPDWNENIRRLGDLVPEFGRIWARHEVAGPQLRERIFKHPDAGLLRFQITELHVGGTSDLRIVTYTPADEDTSARLPLTRREPPPEEAADG